ncbi:MAG: PAS domain S-box protein [Deltaproteobacteria bacterium]|nr:PAS domain S-box protein [Deltaproteobacteria bacterium]
MDQIRDNRPSYEELERKVAALEERLSEKRKGVSGFEARHGHFDRAADNDTDDLSINSEMGPAEIARLKQIIRELEDRNGLLQDILDVTEVVIFVKDLEGRYVFANKEYIKMRPDDQEMAVGEPDFEGHPFEMAAGFRASDRQVLESGKRLTVEERVSIRGKPRTFTITREPLFDKEGEPFAVCGVAHDITERKRTEEVLRQSQEKFSKIFLSSPDCICISRAADSLLIDVNHGFEVLTGFAHDEAVGKAAISLGLWANPIDRERMVSALQVKGEVLNQEFTFRRKDGALRTGIFSARSVEIAEERCLVFVMHDVTERKQMEIYLKAVTKQLQEIIEFLPDATFIVDKDRRIIAWNRAIEDMTGVSKKDILGMDHCFAGVPFYGIQRPCLIDLLGKNDNELVAKYSFVEQKGAAVYAEVFTPALYDGKGAYVWAIASPLLDADGTVVGAIESIRDITEKRRTEEALRDSERRLKDIVGFLPDPTIAIDLEGRVIIWNRAAEEFTGAKAEDMVGKGDYEYSIPFYGVRRALLIDLVRERSPEMENRYEAFRREDETVFGETYVRNVKRGEAYVLGIAAPLYDSEGRLMGAIESFRDITERRRAEEEGKKLEGQLRQAQKMEAIGTLAGGIAHDFNNILGIILGNTELSLLSIGNGKYPHEYLARIETACTRAKDLVRQILAFSRQVEQEREPIKPALIITEALKMLRAALPSTIQIQQDIRKDSGMVLGDPTHIHQILINLCTNGFHAMREKGGILQVSLANVDIEAEEIAKYPDMTPGAYINLTVSDTGHGMDSGVIDRIFDPYFTTKGVGDGTGLGLSVVYGIVRSYKGSIRVHSEVGRGSSFEIFLPRIDVLKDISRTEVTGALRGGSERVLVVDDEESLVFVLRKGLEHLGYQVTVKTDSIEALEVFCARPNDFDLIITDMTMPHMTGVDLAGRMMKMRADIPMILCTGFSELTDEDKAKKLGIRAFIMKPVVLADLAETIRRVLD